MVKIQVNSQGKAYYTSAGKVLLAPEGGSSGKYSLLERISDDSNNEIGTVSGFFTDTNDVEYAVVCLDAQYRLKYGTYCSNISMAITNLPYYQDVSLYSSGGTATFNTQKILDFCIAQSATSTSCTHCRSKSFVIDGVTYYGQLPNIVELIDIFRRRLAINSADTSRSSYDSFKIPTTFRTWSSSQRSSSEAWSIYIGGNVGYSGAKTDKFFVPPVLEIPNAI